jgi:hypothetical protein
VALEAVGILIVVGVVLALVQEPQIKVLTEAIHNLIQKHLVEAVVLVRLEPQVLVLVRLVTAALEWHLQLLACQLFMLAVVALDETRLFLALLMERVETVGAVAVGHLLVLVAQELLILEEAVVGALRPQTVAQAVQA